MIVFLHGVPETASIWDAVRAAIGRESVALELPGFGCERPAGFAATWPAYVDWVVDRLAAIGEPVDLVGHDWGAGLTYRIATAHPEVLRSWVADVGNVAHPDYVWHGFAQVWQTPGDGEAFIDAQVAMDRADLAAAYETMGLTAADADDLAAGLDATMGGCILELYRSATPNWHAHFGPWAPTAVPGLVLSVTDDPFNDDAMAREVAVALGARVEVLDGSDHFWPYIVPAEAAAVLASFWAGVDG